MVIHLKNKQDGQSPIQLRKKQRAKIIKISDENGECYNKLQ